MTNSIPSPQQPPAKTPLDEIALIARAANPGPHHIYTHPRDDNNWKANAAFHEAITPQLVISLIEAIQAKPVPVALVTNFPSPSQHLEGVAAGLKPIPIEAAKRIAKDYGYDQVLIYARRCHDTPEPHGEHITTYGRNREHCDVAARIGDTLKKFMGWEV